VPSPAVGAWEATIQREVAAQAFPTPAVRLTAPEDSALGRWLTVMDLVDGRPPISGLTPSTIAAKVPDLVRGLPDHLAAMAARLHALDPDPLVGQLEALGGGRATDAAAFVAGEVFRADAIARTDLVAVGERLLASQPSSSRRVIAHGDLHPFNLLITADGPVLIDWSVALVAHPAFTVAFTELMLSNPPVPLPRVGAAALQPLARHMARRFLKQYRQQAGPEGLVDDEQLAWHRRLHAYRILVELAGWDAEGTRPTTPHPWFVIEPVAQRLLGLRS
jgi:aminoglycoside phosphotransferase (APT) family kinase protein